MIRSQRGQAMTEMVLLFPIFLFFLFGFVKVFSLLILYQKVEIAAVYAGTRFQFESHRNVDFKADDQAIEKDIANKARRYIGFNSRQLREFLDLDTLNFHCDREAIWSTCTLTVTTRPWRLPFLNDPGGGAIRKNQWKGLKFVKVKYVPSRDRPIRYVLPGGD